VRDHQERPRKKKCRHILIAIEGSRVSEQHHDDLTLAAALKAMMAIYYRRSSVRRPHALCAWQFSPAGERERLAERAAESRVKRLANYHHRSGSAWSGYVPAYAGGRNDAQLTPLPVDFVLNQCLTP
jgi:hypothetical protein